MPFLRQIRVEGLFGLYDHVLDLRKRPPLTIVSGPNGIGKTTLLNLTHSLLSGSYQTLGRTDFQRLSVVTDTGVSLTAIHREKKQSRQSVAAVIELILDHPRRESQSSRVQVPLDTELNVPPWIVQASADLFYDSRTGETMSFDDAARRWSGRQRVGQRRPSPPPEWFRSDDWRTEFIETKRLDSLISRGLPQDPRREKARAPIHYYLDAVREAMERARFESSSIAQNRDRTFARRILDPASRATVGEAHIRARYSEIEQRAADLRRSGLLVDSLEVLSDKRLTPTDRWVLRLFLEDFEAKLEPLGPISAQLGKMQEIVNGKFLNKRMDLDLRKGAQFFDTNGREIEADALSSGEQHELALVSRLLFSVEPGCTVMIDEPELSLHVNWQHRMLDDLTEIAELRKLQIVLATHSTAIINGRWELVEELGPIDDANES